MNAFTNHRSHAHMTFHRRVPLGMFALILACLAALSIAGCTGLTGAGTPAAKSSSTSTSSGTLAASASSLNFGNVVAGSSSPQPLTLTNTGTAAVTISQATVTGAGFSVLGSMSSVSIPAGQNHSFQVQFAPMGAGNASGSISIASDATNSPLAISLSGNGMTTLAITAQPVGQSVVVGQTATFSVVATGTGPLTYQWKKSESDKQFRDSNSDCVRRRAIDYLAARKSNRHGRTNGNIQRGGDRDFTSYVSMEEEWYNHQRCNLGFLYNPGHGRL
jgi:hypothetical protein